MAKVLAGLTKVEYADSVGGSKTEITGKISADASVTVPNTTSETTQGVQFGGGQIQAEIPFMDFADYSTLEGFMTGDDEKSFTLTFADGTSLETQDLVQPIVERQIGVNARDGVVAWTLTLEFYSDGVMLA